MSLKIFDESLFTYKKFATETGPRKIRRMLIGEY